MEINANLIDIAARRIVASRVTIGDATIADIVPLDRALVVDTLPFILPGFIDAHIHIESSMLVPSEFARMAVRHGTIATVSDPHEIANVIGIEGIDFMMEDASKVPLKFFFGAPSCVPATEFETAGARIDSLQVERLLARDEIRYLAEMMNYPGVLCEDPEVMRKLASAKKAGKPIDGHAPGLRGDDAIRYIQAGITTDHECTTLEEAEHKLKHGMKILIREGSAAKNLAALYTLIDRYPQAIMLCSDDKHPDELADSHIDAMVRWAMKNGCDMFHLLTAACINPIDHYSLPVGRLRVGDPADFILVDDLDSWEVTTTFIDGRCVFEHGQSRIDRVDTPVINHFHCHDKSPAEFAIPAIKPMVRVIKAIDGSLITESFEATVDAELGFLQPSLDDDILKLTVVNRYRDAPPATAFVNGFGLRQGAIASSVGHDSHNILAVGTSDEYLAEVVNLIIQHQGGIAAVNGERQCILPLPVAGIMSIADGQTVASEYRQIDAFAKRKLGSKLSAPFMTLSFMALLVIPTLKLSDRGLFDGEKFTFQSLHVEGAQEE